MVGAARWGASGGASGPRSLMSVTRLLLIATLTLIVVQGVRYQLEFSTGNKVDARATRRDTGTTAAESVRTTNDEAPGVAALDEEREGGQPSESGSTSSASTKPLTANAEVGASSNDDDSKAKREDEKALLNQQQQAQKQQRLEAKKRADAAKAAAASEQAASSGQSSTSAPSISPSSSSPSSSSSSSSSSSLSSAEEAPATQVFLHSWGRSGSTLAESYFFATTNVFYLDEPLRHVTYSAGSASGRAEAAMRLLADCTFPEIHYAKHIDFYKWTRYRLVSMSPLSRAPWTLSAVTSSDSTSASTDAQMDPILIQFSGLMQEYCARSRVRAMKEIRFVSQNTNTNDTVKSPERDMDTMDESNMEHLLKTHETAKVIHLIRHPYEVAHSRVKVSWAESPPLQDVCLSSLRDYLAALRHGWQQSGRYKLVKYEELLMRPFDSVRDVHAFMGIDTMERHEMEMTTAMTSSTSPDASSLMNSTATPTSSRSKKDIREMLAQVGLNVAGRGNGVASADLIRDLIYASTSADETTGASKGDDSQGTAATHDGGEANALSSSSSSSPVAAASVVSKKDLDDYGIVRRKIECGDCKTEAVRAVEDAPACVELLSLVPISCCGEHMMAPSKGLR